MPLFTADPAITALPIEAGHECLVIDDALSEPARWVELAARHRDAFAFSPHNAFPGPELPLPDGVTAQLADFVLRHAGARLGARRVLRAYARLAIATLQPAELAPRQWLCHRDRFGVPEDERVLASVLYLFRDPALGGTAFFAPRRSAAETDRLVHASGTDDREAFARHWGVAPGYLTGDNAWFTRLVAVPPRWNRLAIYDGSRFHSSDIAQPERLDPDPRRGRLTLNGFFTCSRCD